ncbi:MULTISPECIES: dihydrolipoamide acetyltransferase family protein [Streptomyces]|uniref:Dihydrolipoamide acetyltransferase component of pyruvate dehydrogenase complex n=1 Tax=Streptomyces coelicolor (strain ATCC BAA-471 / A3(2) / M145) TaxID=100226 RepID=Q9XA49_STRCO|nr:MULTISPECIES: 2-oxo acid dehydrogenase subunit E2 [Streptomyces]MDX2925135.1 dihydrolipoamide acetyltransferase family protein [Streptomyces sp. NRRL_B-16638]MDX3411141.1 dihydrolipoamide acetyltransferase family protein [Streptomyces sp. ME02-6977A]MYU43352.1 2-oxo acid dehydrogenase subunit E2 [Streptomyces sp. SID7813]NSL78830.1 2-oxo acid dehydrogenase subunit E2 [Streptomyces coelicolor]QFI43833.1 2-oxo acid dehydrogenase subunit E2 [Streptomyces coelicolor A3(2)]
MAHASDGHVLEFKLPDLGEGLTEAEIVRWLVEVGDVVAVDQPVVEVETAKAMVEVPCPYGGVVTARFGEEGTELPVGAPLVTVTVGGGGAAADGPARDSGTDAGAAGTPVAGTPAAAAAETSPAAETKAEGSGNVLVGYGTSEAPARRRRVRPGRQAATGASGRANGRVRGAGAVDGPVRTAEPADGPVPVISPLVRRLARQHDLDLRELTGSGPDGLILRADVEYALRAAAAQGGRTADPEAGTGRVPDAAPAAVSSAPRSDGTRVPLKGVRGAVADKLSRSRREIPDATCWVDADATELMRARTAMNASGGPKISLVALLARICTAALARFPELNSTVDTDAREVVRLDRVHLGFAAQTDRGLVVPVVRDAHTRDAEALTAEFARLTEAARAGRLTPGELTGGTFTLNNYGVFGVDGSTPIINHPEAAMLGVGRIVPKPWVHEGELAVRQVVQLSLTFDHRVCDGGTAGGFLRYVADCVEQPAVLLRTL